MTTDSDIQILPGWGTNLGTQGGIGDAFPQVFQLTQTSVLGLFIQGCKTQGGYAAGEIYLSRPIPEGASRLCLSYDISVDLNSLQFAQAIETDIILTDAQGYKYNGSVQLDYSKGGMIEVAGPTGGWLETGNAPGPYIPNLVHHVEINYTFDFSKRTISNIGVELDEVLWATPASLQNVAAQQSNWKDFNRAMIQIQVDLNQKAGQFAEIINNLTLTWD